MSPIFDGIDNGSIPVHPFQRFGHVFIKPHALKEPVEQPIQEKTGLVLQNKRVKGFFFRHDTIPFLQDKSYNCGEVLARNKSSERIKW